MIREGDIVFLERSLTTLEKDFEDLKRAYDKKDSVKFNALKRKTMSTERGIAEAAR